MNPLETQIQMWHDYKAQCTNADGLPDFDQYAALQVYNLTVERAALLAELERLQKRVAEMERWAELLLFENED